MKERKGVALKGNRLKKGNKVSIQRSLKEDYKVLITSVVFEMKTKVDQDFGNLKLKLDWIIKYRNLFHRVK